MENIATLKENGRDVEVLGWGDEDGDFEFMGSRMQQLTPKSM